MSVTVLLLGKGRRKKIFSELRKKTRTRRKRKKQGKLLSNHKFLIITSFSRLKLSNSSCSQHAISFEHCALCSVISGNF